MRRIFTVPGALAALGAIPFLIVLFVMPGQRSRAVDIYLLFVGGLLLLALARATAGERPKRRTSLLDVEKRRRREEERLPELARMEREVVLATGSEFDQHMRVKPLLRDIVEHRLWTRHGVELEQQPEQAEELLGPELWDLIRPGPPNPNSRWIRGLDLKGLQRAVDRIEQI